MFRSSVLRSVQCWFLRLFDQRCRRCRPSGCFWSSRSRLQYSLYHQTIPNEKSHSRGSGKLIVTLRVHSHPSLITMSRVVLTLLSECVYFIGFLGRLLIPCKNMTEDDWRWHMYDTVRPICRQTHSLAYMHLLTLTGQRVRLAR